MGRSWLIDGGDEPAIFEVQLGIHEDVEIDVQSAGRSFCCLSQLDCDPFAGILYATATAMKPVIIGCHEVKPQSELGGQELPQRYVGDHGHLGMSLAAGGKEFLCLAPLLISAHPLAEELIGDPLDRDLNLRDFWVEEALRLASKGLLCGNILEEHQDALHAAGGHVKLMFHRVSLLSLLILRCRSTRSYRIARRPLY